MNRISSQAFSWLFHPLWTPLYGFLIILYCFPYHYQYITDKMYNVTLFALIMMMIVTPGLVLLIMKKLDIVSDIDVEDKRQRILPYMAFLFFYLMSYLLVKPKEVKSIIFMQDPLLSSVILGATISLAICFFINNFYKVSVHSMGISSLFVFSCLITKYTNQDTYLLNIVLLILVGFVGASRLYLNRHSILEVYLGILVAILGQGMAFFFIIA